MKKSKYSLKSLLEDKAITDEERDEAKTSIDAGIQGSLKGKAEQLYVADYLETQANTIGSGFKVLGTTKMGSGPDVLVLYDGTLYEVEVKSGGGNVSKNSAAEALKDKLEYKASGATASSSHQETTSIIKTKVPKNQKSIDSSSSDWTDLINALEANWKKSVTMDKGFVDNMTWRPDVTEGEKALAGIGSTFFVLYVSIVAGASIATMRLTDLGFDWPAKAWRVRDAKKIIPSNQGFGAEWDGYDSSDSGSVTAGSSTTILLKGFTDSLDGRIKAIYDASNKAFQTMAAYVNDRANYTDEEWQTVEAAMTNTGTASPAKLMAHMAAYWSSDKTKSAWDNFFDSTNKMTKGNLARTKNFIGDPVDALSPHTLFYTAVIDHHIGIGYLPKDIDSGKRKDYAFNRFLKGAELAKTDKGFAISATLATSLVSAVEMPADKMQLPIKGQTQDGLTNDIIGFFGQLGLIRNKASFNDNDILIWIDGVTIADLVPGADPNLASKPITGFDSLLRIGLADLKSIAQVYINTALPGGSTKGLPATIKYVDDIYKIFKDLASKTTKRGKKWTPEFYPYAYSNANNIGKLTKKGLDAILRLVNNYFGSGYDNPLTDPGNDSTIQALLKQSVEEVYEEYNADDYWDNPKIPKELWRLAGYAGAPTVISIDDLKVLFGLKENKRYPSLMSILFEEVEEQIDNEENLVDSLIATLAKETGDSEEAVKTNMEKAAATME